MHHAVASKHFHDPMKQHQMCADAGPDSIATDTQRVPTDLQRRSWIRTTITDPAITVSTPSSNPDNKQRSETGQAITGGLAETLCKSALSFEPVSGCSPSTNLCPPALKKAWALRGRSDISVQAPALIALSWNRSLCSSTRECRWALMLSNGNFSSFSIHGVWFRCCVISDQLMT